MVTICTAWKQAVEGDEQVWAKNYIRLLHACFMERGMTDTSCFGRGLKRLTFRGNPFLPTQGEFVEMCQPQPEDFDLPELDAGFIQAQRIWLHKDLPIHEAHPVFHHMAANNIFHVFGFKNARSAEMKMWKQEFKLALHQCMWHLSNGGELGEAPLPLEHKREVIQPTDEDIEATADTRASLMEAFA